MLYQKPAEITEGIISVLSQFLPVFLCECLPEEPISAITTLSFFVDAFHVY